MGERKMNEALRSRVPRERMAKGARKYWDFYDVVPGAGFYQREFGYYSLEKWQREEGLEPGADIAELFGFDEPGRVELGGLGWCEAGFEPVFEEKVLEDRGDYELVQDFAGRGVLCFKGRRDGFMPEYVTHPVTDMRSFEENCLWRMDPGSGIRQANMDAYLDAAEKKALKGLFVGQSLVGGYMYLRSLIGPEQLLYTFYDDPELIHACMRAWFELADSVIGRHQERLPIDELFIAEDICYNHGPLISPDMIREFLFPYYQQLLSNMKRRQAVFAPGRTLHLQVDTDGYSDSVLEVYREIGLNFLSPFEQASNCDILGMAKKYPDLRISGGVDKREMAKGKEAIDRLVERIFPTMHARGGYYPTCDHGVPEEVSLENYLYYRKRCLEFA